MKKLAWWQIASIEAFVVISTLIFNFAFLHYYTFHTPITNNIVQVLPERNLTAEIQNIMDKIANHEYEERTYDCTEFSRDLILALNKSGISAYCLSGGYLCKDKVGLHTWVEIMADGKIYPVEATIGEFINASDYKKCYHEVERGYCF
jgi:hypothetical protein